MNLRLGRGLTAIVTLLRLRRGSDVLIKMPADGLGNVRE